MARQVHQQTLAWSKAPLQYQQKIFENLIAKGSQTLFGKDHHFDDIKSYDDFKKAVPIRDYEQLKPYIEKILQGESDILWQGKPIYFAKTSGTTSGTKYIPITRDSIPNHINTARNALLAYVHEKGDASFINGKLIFLSGSPELSKKSGINTGRLSGIVNHHVPAYLRRSQMPTYLTNCIEDWETKLDAIVGETISANMTLISGIPPWVQMYFDRLVEKSGKKVGELFPNFNLLVQGGVNFEPYKKKLFETIGRPVDVIETYPASEGFIAYQDSQKEEGLLLNINSGIFFEFIPASEIFNENPTRLSVNEVELGVNYAIIINSNAGLWGYNIGDTVKFVSLNPLKILVTGRIKHFISAFGEHVIAEEVEYALMQTAKEENLEVVEFTVAPNINPKEGGLPYHEWFVEFGNPPANMSAFKMKVDEKLRHKNIYYDDLIKGGILQPLLIREMQKNAFINYMKSVGKLGGQNKVPRLSNDRILADELLNFYNL
ncbi:MAG: GH3 auxin-responsive promoter family protein [Bacteroidetes bacterium]|nr:GH3 auxin-responsive promoter family protein [Bacteroidota bacterium]